LNVLSTACPELPSGKGVSDGVCVGIVGHVVLDVGGVHKVTITVPVTLHASGVATLWTSWIGCP